MQRQTPVLIIGAALLLIASAIVVPQMLTSDEPAPMRWTERDEVEIAADPEAATATASGTDVERTVVDVATGSPSGDDSRVAVILRGRVVDKFQRPVASAKVWLDFGRAGARGGPVARQRRIPDPVQTDGEGRFAFQGQAFRNLQVSLQVLHATHAPGLFDKYVGEVGSEAAGEVELGDLVLVSGGELIGRVTDLDGNGVAGALLRLQPENGNRMRMLRDRDNLLPDFPTDNNGYFRRGNLAAGDWSVTVTAKQHTEGRSPVFAAENEQTVELEDIRLGPGYEVTGYVRNVQGQPIGKAEVRLRSEERERGPRGGGPGGGREHRATTDAEGRFFLEHLPATPMTLDATADGYLDTRQEKVDATLGQPLQVTMQDGLRIAGVALDADGTPVTRFAARAIRVRGLPVPGQASDPAELAARLRSGTLDDATRQQLRAQFEDRRGGRGDNGGGPGGQRPGQGLRDLGKAEAHPAGEFLLTGLQEGVYELHIQSPDHARYRSAEIELRLAAVPPRVVANLDHGVYVAGVVTNDSGLPVRNARVTLRTAAIADPAATTEAGRRRGRGGAVEGFVRQMAAAATSLETTTDAEGEFVLKHAVRGTYKLQAEAQGFADAATEPFDLQNDRSGFVLKLGPLGSIAGTVRGLRDAEFGEARVGAVPIGSQNGGGFGSMFGRGGGQGGNPFRSVVVAADGSYRIDDLVPGDYLVRSWIGSPQDLMRELAPKFFDGSLVADVAVRGGDVVKFDVTVVRPLVGSVAGSVLHNGTPASGFQIELSRQGDEGAAADRGPQGGPGGRGGMFGNFGRSFQAAVAASGQFRIDNVPAGTYRLRVQAGRRGGMLHEEVVDVVTNVVTERSIVVATQSLQGTITVDDGSDPKALGGRVSLLPNLTALPENLGAWQRENTAFDARLQNGAFRFDALKPGSYLLVLTVRGRERSTLPIVVGAGSTDQIVVPAGKPSTAPPSTGAANPAARPAGARAR